MDIDFKAKKMGFGIGPPLINEDKFGSFDVDKFQVDNGLGGPIAASCFTMFRPETTTDSHVDKRQRKWGIGRAGFGWRW